MLAYTQLIDKLTNFFQDTVNPFCLCNAETETTSHYIFHCSLFSEQRTKLLESLSNLENTLLNNCDGGIVDILLFVSSKYNFSTNNKILKLSLEFSESTKHFEKPLFWIASTFHGSMMSSSAHKMSLCCRQHHVDGNLTLGQGCVFSWQHFITNCYNFVFKK